MTDVYGRGGPQDRNSGAACTGCGAPAGGEMFCAACGGYLGWDDTGGRTLFRCPPAAEADPVGISPLPPAEPGIASNARGPVPVSLPPSGPYPPQARAFPPRYPPAPPAWPEPGGEYPTYAMVQPCAPTVAAQYPEPAARAPSPRTAACPECRTDNSETRTYCSPCGAALRPEAEPARRTRVEALRERWRERPRPWHLDRRWCGLLVLLPVLFALGLLLGWSGTAVRGVIPTVEDRFSHQVAMAPGSVEATSAATGYEADKAIDGVDNRAWAPARHGQDAIGESLTAKFPRPFRLTGLVIIDGASKKPAEYLSAGRPTSFTAIAVTASGATEHKELCPADQPGPQDFRWGVDDVVAVELRIAGVHPGLKPDAPVALAEVEFFTRQGT